MKQIEIVSVEAERYAAGRRIQLMQPVLVVTRRTGTPVHWKQIEHKPLPEAITIFNATPQPFGVLHTAIDMEIDIQHVFHADLKDWDEALSEIAGPTNDIADVRGIGPSGVAKMTLVYETGAGRDPNTVNGPGESYHEWEFLGRLRTTDAPELVRSFVTEDSKPSPDPEASRLRRSTQAMVWDWLTANHTADVVTTDLKGEIEIIGGLSALLVELYSQKGAQFRAPFQNIEHTHFWLQRTLAHLTTLRTLKDVLREVQRDY